jgi:3-hydroxybutyryl-CoA dehydrogenase
MKVQDITTIGVAGAGTMGSGIAQLFARRGYDVRVVDLDEESLERSKRLVALLNSSLIEQGIMTEQEAARTVDRISYHLDQGVLHDADVIVESIVERLDVKQVFWQEVEAVARHDAVFATNTSGLSINGIAENVKNKGRFIGMHFWNPPHIIPLVELIRADETEDGTVEVLKDLLNAIDKEPVVVQKDAPGFIGNRLQFAVFREALHIVAEGIATPEDVDRAMRYGPGFRYPILGPLQTADLGGLDIFCSIASYLFESLSDMKEPPEMLKYLMETGQLGVKSGRGFYDYSNGKDVTTIKRRDKMFLEMLKHIHSSQKEC